jgi:hypothetical protein
MSPVLQAVGAVLVAALIVRQSTRREAGVRLAVVAGVALGVRVLAVTIIQFNAIRTHGEGTWLNDEASFFLAAESLLPNPFDKALPQGLGHLGGNAYLGILTAISMSLGHMDSVAFRLTNALLGTFVAMLASMVAAAFVGGRAGLVAGIVVALWPTLVLWSATFLRDTLGSFVVLALWWTLVYHKRVNPGRVIGVVVLALILLTSLRPYLAGAVALGVGAWATVPWLARRSRQTVAIWAAVIVMVGGAVAIQQSQQIDKTAHALVYRQMTTRIEALGHLYHDLNPDSPPIDGPFGPGAAVARIEPGSDWLLTGLVQEPIGPGLVSVAYTDGSVQNEQIASLVLLQSAPLVPIQMVASLGPGLVSFVTGASDSSDTSSPAWIADALAWDALFVLAVLGGLRARVPVREWLFPACVVLGTVAALVAVPGAPGNDNRHRSTQTLPLLVVFAAGLLVSRPRPSALTGLAVSRATTSPASAGTAAASRTRSLR